MDRQQRRVRRRDGLEHDLRRHEVRRTLLRDKRERTQAVHAAAHRALVEAEAALARATALYDSAEQDCAELRHLMTFDPDTVDDLPTELLDAVFLSLATERDPLWPHIDDAEYNETRARQPDRLAAVCRRWRNVALANSRLWTYVALPRFFNDVYGEPRQERMSRLPASIDLRLRRSRSLAIDVCLHYVDAASSSSQHYMSRLWDDIFPLVAEHAGRWRRVKMRLSFRASTTFEALVAGTPMPLLEELCLYPYRYDTELGTSWLLRAPALRHLSASIFRFTAGPSAVVSATFDVTASNVADFLDALRQMPVLTTLSVHLNLGYNFEPLPTQTVCLVAMTSLQLQGDVNVQDLLALQISAPQTTRVKLAVDGLHFSKPEEMQYLMLAFPNISELELEPMLHSRCHERPGLRAFTHIQRLTFTKCAIPEKFFRWMDDDSESGHALFSQLESLTIRDPRKSDGRLHLRALTRFVRTRAGACCARGKQFSVALEWWPSRFPLWFRRALGAALGSSNVRLTGHDCVVYDAVGDPCEGRDQAAQLMPLEDEESDDDDYPDGPIWASS